MYKHLYEGVTVKSIESILVLDDKSIHLMDQSQFTQRPRVVVNLFGEVNHGVDEMTFQFGLIVLVLKSDHLIVILARKTQLNL
jgi:hypothetical protein